jgi:hypothetical protein
MVKPSDHVWRSRVYLETFVLNQYLGALDLVLSLLDDDRPRVTSELVFSDRLQFAAMMVEKWPTCLREKALEVSRNIKTNSKDFLKKSFGYCLKTLFAGSADPRKPVPARDLEFANTIQNQGL